MGFLLTRVGSLALVVAATMAVSPAADAAPSWAPPTTLGPSDYLDGAPAVAVAPDGEAIAAWVGGGGSGPTTIEVSTRRPGEGWSPPITIARARATEEVQGPRIAVSAGKAVIVWSDTIRTPTNEPRVVLAATRLRGKRWSKPQSISLDRGEDSEPQGEEPQVAMTPRGRAIVVWSASKEGNLTVSFVASATQAAAGTDWTAPVGIRGSYGGVAPQVATTPEGEAVAIWAAFYNGDSSIAASSRPPKGPWRGAWPLAAAGGFPQPRLAVTSRGEAIGAWVRAPESAFEKVQVTTRTPGGRWRVKTLAPQDHGTAPRIVTEPGGRATVLWARSVSAEEHTIVASTHRPSGAWNQPRSVAAQGLQLTGLTESSIAVTRKGESIAIWASGKRGEGTTIHSSSRRRRQPWSEPTKVFSSPPGQFCEVPDLQLALAPDGKAFAVWRCFDGTRWVTKAATRSAARPGS